MPNLIWSIDYASKPVTNGHQISVNFFYETLELWSNEVLIQIPEKLEVKSIDNCLCEKYKHETYLITTKTTTNVIKLNYI